MTETPNCYGMLLYNFRLDCNPVWMYLTRRCEPPKTPEWLLS